MKTLRTLFVIAVATLGFATSSFAQLTNSATQTASATVIKALTIESKTPLNFGTFAGKNAATSTVIIGVDGSRSGTADLVASGAGSVGTFQIKGETDAIVSVTMPAGTTSLTAQGGSGGAAMTILSSDWTTDQSDLGNVQLSGGDITLTVGATLNVGTAQKADTYQGNYTVTVNYN